MKVVIEGSPWSKSNPGSPKSGDSPGWGSGDFAQQHTRLSHVQGAWNDSHFKGIFIPYRGKSDWSFPNRESSGFCILLESFCDAVSLRISMIVGRKVFDHVTIPCPTLQASLLSRNIISGHLVHEPFAGANSPATHPR